MFAFCPRYGDSVPVGRRFVGVQTGIRLSQKRLSMIWKVSSIMRNGFFYARHCRVRAGEQHERVPVAMARAVEGPLRAVAPLDFPVVAFIDRVPMGRLRRNAKA